MMKRAGVLAAALLALVCIAYFGAIQQARRARHAEEGMREALREAYLAQAAEEAGQWPLAALHLTHVLALAPEDAAVSNRLLHAQAMIAATGSTGPARG
jgi:hypothetical protein